MNISQYLKNIGMTKTQLAEEIGLSRPTLNQYIDLFESGQKIENGRYDIIFRRLFSERQASKDQFQKKMNAVKFLLERDKKYDIGGLDPKAADIVARVHNNMVNDMADDSWNRKVYDAILIMLTNYRKNALLRELASYFSDLNSDSDLSSLNDESKAYYSFYYKMFRLIIDNQPDLDFDSYKDFLARKEFISKKREERNEHKAKLVRKKLEDALREVELNCRENGVEITEEEIMNEVIRRMRK